MARAAYKTSNARSALWYDELFLAASFVALVGGFLASSVYYHRRTDRLAARSRAASESVAPHVSEELGQLRRELRAIESDHGRVGLLAYALDGMCVVVGGGLTLRALRAMRRHRRDAEARIDELQMFAARVAHDVRSPLMPALLALQRVASKTPQEDPVYAPVKRGEHSLQAIARIVEGLLRFATAGAAPDPNVSSSLRDAIDDVLAEYLDEAMDRKIELSCDCREDCTVKCAPGVLVSILGNLVANAIKYMGDRASERRVVVRASVSGRRVLIEVDDTGPGLAPGAEARIFEPYVRMNAEKGGIGLGLATVKRLAEAHGGAVGVERKVPAGSVFWVALPTFAPRPAVRALGEATSMRRRAGRP
jgi:signal transduction histidine kinase